MDLYDYKLKITKYNYLTNMSNWLFYYLVMYLAKLLFKRTRERSEESKTQFKDWFLTSPLGSKPEL